MESENRLMDNKRQMSRPLSGWARRKKLIEVEDKKTSYVTIIINYSDYNHISYHSSSERHN